MKIKFCLICIFLCVIFSTKSQSIFDAAKQLEMSGKFIEASVMYERVLFEPENSKQFYQAVFAKIECLKRQQLYSDAVEFIKKNVYQIIGDSLKNNIYSQWALCNYLNNQLDEAISIVEQTKIYFPLYADTKWLNFIKIVSLNEQTKWNEAKLVYGEWLKSNQMDSTLICIYDSIPKLKSERKASLLATFIPAGGLIYAGKYGEAITSIILQSAGLYYAFVSYEAKYYLSAWLVGTGIAGSFYFGSGRRTETVIKDYNKKKAAAFNDKLKFKLIEQIKTTQKN